MFLVALFESKKKFNLSKSFSIILIYFKFLKTNLQDVFFFIVLKFSFHFTLSNDSSAVNTIQLYIIIILQINKRERESEKKMYFKNLNKYI
jgi:hypothetical protein